MLNMKWKIERERTIEIDKRIEKFVANDPFKASSLEEKAPTHQVEQVIDDQETNK